MNLMRAITAGHDERMLKEGDLQKMLKSKGPLPGTRKQERRLLKVDPPHKRIDMRKFDMPKNLY